MPPTPIGIEDAVSISSGFAHHCVGRRNGTVSCWGANSDGQLGDGTSEDRTFPVDVVGIADATAVGLGDWHSCAVVAGGHVACWGRNGGRLGDGTIMTRDAPAQVVGLDHVVQVDGGSETTCALTHDGVVYCWGVYVGDSSPTKEPRLQPDGPVPELSNVAEVRTQENPICTRSSGGAVFCWADIWGGGLVGGSVWPVSVPTLDGSRGLAVGKEHACSISPDEDVLCIGRHVGTIDEVSPPSSPQRMALRGVLGITTTSELAGAAHTCALTREGDVLCWGADGGALGGATGEPSATPVRVEGL